MRIVDVKTGEEMEFPTMIPFNKGDMELFLKHHLQYRYIDSLTLDEIKDVALQIGIRVISKISCQLEAMDKENEE